MALEQILALQGGDWSAVGHQVGAVWAAFLDVAAEVLFVLSVLALVARAVAQRRRYRAVGALSETDLGRLHAALVAAERRTVGEIVPVVVERSDPHPGAAWLAAFALVFTGSLGFLEDLPWDRPLLALAAQLALGAVGYGLATWLPGFRQLFIRPARAQAVAEEQAFQEFYSQGLHETEARTGVLLFVSLLEHRVVVLADTGIAEVVPPEAWVATDRAILADVRRGSLTDGLEAGIRAAGDLLEQHFPWREGDRNEVPDRIVVRRE